MITASLCGAKRGSSVLRMWSFFSGREMKIALSAIRA
jgi:hypothetical protein